MACNIMLSGNNYSKIALLLKFMNIRIVAPRTFYSIQDVYCVDSIKECWMEQRQEVINQIKHRDVVLIGEKYFIVFFMSLLKKEVNKVIHVILHQQLMGGWIALVTVLSTVRTRSWTMTRRTSSQSIPLTSVRLTGTLLSWRKGHLCTP